MKVKKKYKYSCITHNHNINYLDIIQENDNFTLWHSGHGVKFETRKIAEKYLKDNYMAVSLTTVITSITEQIHKDLK